MQYISKLVCVQELISFDVTTNIVILKQNQMDKEIKLNTKGLEALMGKGLMSAEEMK